MKSNIRPSVAIELIQNNDPSLTGLDLSNSASYEMKCAQYSEQLGRVFQTTPISHPLVYPM